MKRATADVSRSPIKLGYFNPRPREEGDIISAINVAEENISIHALVKRATDWEANFPDMYDISIHALVKRATKGTNPVKSNLAISIHALVKRATLDLHMRLCLRRYFNPRPREEGDKEGKKKNAYGWIISIHALVKRATRHVQSGHLPQHISIHALVKRATV